MKRLFPILVLSVLSCNSKTGNGADDSSTDGLRNSVVNQAERTKYYTQKDTLLVSTEVGDPLRFSKAEFNQIVDNHPELYSKFHHSADYLYYQYGNTGDFRSEAGQDSYYVLYAYFLKQKNGIETYMSQRNALVAIYSNINDLFAHFQYGGTFFGHQTLRILGYAEYSVYLYSIKNDKFEKTYNIATQKTLYIKSLRQMVADESNMDFETLGEEKVKRTKMMNQIIDKLDSLITDVFYLRRAQAFQYEHYEYW